MTTGVGLAGILLTGLILGWFLGIGTVQAIDSKRRYEKRRADEAEREQKLAEGRANQAARQHEQVPA